MGQYKFIVHLSNSHNFVRICKKNGDIVPSSRNLDRHFLPTACKNRQKFIQSHLTRKPHQEILILISLSRSVHSISDGAVSRELEPLNNCVEVTGSCDGLVLLVAEENVKFLVNPITQQQIKITDSPLAPSFEQRREL